MRSLSQRMLQLAMRDGGISTHDIAEELWPESFVETEGRETLDRNILTSLYSSMVIHEREGRVQRIQWTGPPAPIYWRITPKGRAWLQEGTGSGKGRGTFRKRLELTDRRGGATTRDIVRALYPDRITQEPARKRSNRLHRLLIRVRNEMVYHEKNGRVQRMGKQRGAYHNIKSDIWQTTAYGEQWLTDNHPEHRRLRQVAIAKQDEKRQEREQRQQDALAKAKEQYGPGTDIDVRRRVANQLRWEEGCTLQAIAEVFGVTRQLISLDTLKKAA